MKKKIKYESRWNEKEYVPESGDAMRVAVVSAGSGAGGSFVTGLLAAQMRSRRRVTVAEFGRPYYYEALGMDSLTQIWNYQFYQDAADRKSVSELMNVLHGINWAVRRPGTGPCEDSSMLFRCINRLPGDLLLMDCSGVEVPGTAAQDTDLLFSVMAESDCSVVVIDPLPTKLLGCAGFLESLVLRSMEDAGQRIIYVINRMNSAVREKELQHFLGRRDYAVIPLAAGELSYRAEYDCVLPLDLPEGDCLVASAEKLWARILG